jgi:mannose-6-phosphate isomerase-like protein (cupin superfamily)
MSNIFVNDITDRHCPVKSWGWEEWVVNNDFYCGKRLHFTVCGGSTSLHFHARKHETMFVESGTFMVTTVDPLTAEHAHHELLQGDSIVITPNLVHRITNTGFDSAGHGVMVEFSTHHEDDDSYRVQK